MPVILIRAGVENGDFVDALAIRAGVVVIFAEKKVRRRACITEDYVGGHDALGIIPTETAGTLLGSEVRGKMEEESARTVVGIGDHPEEHVAVRRNHRRGGPVVADGGW